MDTAIGALLKKLYCKTGKMRIAQTEWLQLRGKYYDQAKEKLKEVKIREREVDALLQQITAEAQSPQQEIVITADNF